MSKTLNIEISVRRMQAQNIMTASGGGNVLNDPSDVQLAPSRGGSAGAVSVRAGF